MALNSTLVVDFQQRGKTGARRQWRCSGDFDALNSLIQTANILRSNGTCLAALHLLLCGVITTQERWFERKAPGGIGPVVAKNVGFRQASCPESRRRQALTRLAIQPLQFPGLSCTRLRRHNKTPRPSRENSSLLSRENDDDRKTALKRAV